MIECRDIRFAFGEMQVLRGVSLVVDDGTCVVLRGRSGGGKTTLLRVLSRLLPAQSGYLKVGSHEVNFAADQGQRSIAFQTLPLAVLSMVHQQKNLWPNLTVGQNIALVTTGNKASPLDDAVHVLLETLDVRALIDRFPMQCSVGQRQRLAVARALLSPAQHILMDEPTSALDRGNREKVRDLIAGETKKGRSFLIISHDDRDLMGAYDQLYELENGLVKDPTTSDSA